MGTTQFLQPSVIAAQDIRIERGGHIVKLVSLVGQKLHRYHVRFANLA